MRAAVRVATLVLAVSLAAPARAALGQAGPAASTTIRVVPSAGATEDRRLSDLEQLVRAHALVIAAQRQMLDGLASRLDELLSLGAPAAGSAASAPQAVALQTPMLPSAGDRLHEIPAPEPPETAAMSPDRPGFGEGADVLGRGQFELEAGLTYSNAGGVRLLTMPNTLLRFGLFNGLEARIGTDGLSFERGDDAPRSGTADLRASVKFRVLDQDTAGIEMSIIPVVSLPTGTGGFSSGGLDPTVKVALGRNLPAGFSLGGNALVSIVTDSDGRFTQRAISAGVTHGVGARWSGFVEAYAVTPSDRGQATAVALDWGATRQIGDNVQFDLEAGRGLTPRNWFVGFGLSVRHPLWNGTGK